MGTVEGDMRPRTVALTALLVVGVLCVVGLKTGWRAHVVAVRQVSQEVWAAWIWFGIPSGVVGALVGGLRRRQAHPATAAFSAVLGGLIGSGLAGIVALVPYLGSGILAVVMATGLSVVGAVVGWTAGGSGSRPTLALVGAVAGTLAFVGAAPMLSGVGDLGAPYALVIGMLVGGFLWMIRLIAAPRTGA